MRTVEEFTETVMARVRMPEPVNLEDASSVRGGCYTLFQEGFTVDEAAKFCRLLEEVSPDLAEEKALKRMADLKEIVRLRKNET